MEVIVYNSVLNMMIVENLKHYKTISVYQKNTYIDIQIIVMSVNIDVIHVQCIIRI